MPSAGLPIAGHHLQFGTKASANCCTVLRSSARSKHRTGKMYTFPVWVLKRTSEPANSAFAMYFHCIVTVDRLVACRIPEGEKTNDCGSRRAPIACHLF